VAERWLELLDPTKDEFKAGWKPFAPQVCAWLTNVRRATTSVARGHGDHVSPSSHGPDLEERLIESGDRPRRHGGSARRRARRRRRASSWHHRCLETAKVAGVGQLVFRVIDDVA
jgi:hypothetical protein